MQHIALPNTLTNWQEWLTAKPVRFVPMAFSIAGLEDLPALERFLIETEWKAVAFSSRVRGEQPLSEKRGYIIMVNYLQGRIEEAVMFTPGGLVLPLLKHQSDLAAACNRSAVNMVLRFCPAIYSIMGIRQDVLQIEDLIGSHRKASVEYYLMVLRKEDWKIDLPVYPGNMVIRKAVRQDLKLLFPLQEMYEIEEVCLHPNRFSRKNCLQNLKRNLLAETIFIAEMDGVFVAKAATNARGYNVDQIGGVYTIAEKRNLKIGFAITGELLKYIFNTKQMVVLFVKTANAAALKLYRNLGFREAEKYRITYYNV